MKRLQSLCVVLAAAACTFFASCTKYETQAAKDVNGTVSITITGEIGEFQGETKGSIVNSVRLGWSANDKVYVYNGSTYLGELTAPATIEDDRVAELSGTITAPASTPATLTFISSNTFTGEPTVNEGAITVDMSTQTDVIPFVVYGKADYTSAGISNLVVPFKFATSAVKVSVTKLEPGIAISKACLLRINTKCVLTLGESGTVTVNGSTPGVITRTETSKSASASGYAFIEMGVPKSDANADRTVTVYQNSIQSGKALTSEIGESKYVNSIAELQSGLFSVSADKKVRFSKGNLYYDGNAFKFEDNQYDYRHYQGIPNQDTEDYKTAVINGISTTTPSGTVGSFFWSKKASVAYASTYSDDSATENDVFFTNDTETTPNSDFAVNGATGVWRMLSGHTYGEWKWLIGPNPKYDTEPNPGTNCRTSSTINGTDNARYAEVMVNNWGGLLIFPDVFTWPSDVLFIPSTFNTWSETWNDVNYGTDDFAKLEAAGCVFLPLSGGRADTVAFHIDLSGRYFSSTAYDNDAVYYLNIDNEDVDPDDYDMRFDAYPVRLVSAAQ